MGSWLLLCLRIRPQVKQVLNQTWKMIRNAALSRNTSPSMTKLWHTGINPPVLSRIMNKNTLSREYLRILWFLGGSGGGDQKGCIPGCTFSLNAYLRTLFRFMFQERPQWADFTILTLWEKDNKLNVAAGSSFYANCCFNIKHVEIKCNTRKVAGSRPTRNIVNTFCSHFLSSFYKRLLCRKAWLIFSYALFKHRIFLSRLTNIINVIVYFVFSFSYLKKFYAFETSRLSGFRGCLHFLLGNIVVTAQKHTTRVRCPCTDVWPLCAVCCSGLSVA